MFVASLWNKRMQDQPEQPDYLGEPDQPDPLGELDQTAADQTDPLGGQADQPDQPDKPGKLDQPDQHGEPGQADQPDQLGETERPGQAGQLDQPEIEGKPEVRQSNIVFRNMPWNVGTCCFLTCQIM